MRLAEALEQTPTQTLRRVADAHGLAYDDSTTREELIGRLADRLGDDAYTRELVRGLTPEEREVLAAAHATAGELRGLLLDESHPGLTDDLAQRGWLFRVFSAAGPLRGEVYVVPDEFLTLLPVEPRQELAAPASAEPPAEPRWTDPAFSLFTLASALTRGGPGNALERDVRAWSEEPGGWGWDARWNFLQHLALAAGLLTHRADGALAVAPGLPRLLDEGARLAERVWRSYLRDRGWSELQHAGLPVDEAPDLVDGPALRLAMSHVIDELPIGAWLPLQDVAAWVQQTRPTLLREQLTPRGLVEAQALDWTRLELPLLRYFLLGPLYWLGTVAASRDGTRIARRDPSRQDASPEACQWEATTELVVPARTRLGALLRAERYLVLRERGRVSRYHLVQSHVAAALSSGGSIAECRQLLSELTRAELPEAIDARLSAWEQRFGALHIRPAVLLETQDARELDAAVADENVRQFVRGRLGPTAVEVAAADALELAAALRAADHLPRVDAALRLAAQPRQAFGGLVDEQVLEFLLVSLLAFQAAWPERLADLEGSAGLLERLQHQFPPERLAELRSAAKRLSGRLTGPPRSVRPKRKIVTSR